MGSNRKERRSFISKIPVFHQWADHGISWEGKESHPAPEKPLKMSAAKLGLTHPTEAFTEAQFTSPQLIICGYVTA